MMINSDYLKHSCNQLNKYHLLQKEWKYNVECKVNSAELNSILNILKQKWSDLFDHVETVGELNTSVKHYYKYYNEVKKDSKRESACESTEVAFSAIQNNFQYVAHCYFKDVRTFDFKALIISTLKGIFILPTTLNITSFTKLSLAACFF